MQRLCAILIIVPIAGSCSDRKSDLAACQLEAVRRYPEAKGGSLSDYSNFVGKCMEAKGYTLNTSDK
jgi:hypothetical protein